MEFFKQEYWSGLLFPPPGNIPKPGIKPESPASPALAGRFFTIKATWEAPQTLFSSLFLDFGMGWGWPCSNLKPAVAFPECVGLLCHCLVGKLCPTLWRPHAYSPAGSSVHGVSQASTLEWVTISFSRGSSWPKEWTCVSCIAGFFTAESSGKPYQGRGTCLFFLRPQYMKYKSEQIKDSWYTYKHTQNWYFSLIKCELCFVLELYGKF